MNFISKKYGCRSKGLRSVKMSEKLKGIQKSLMNSFSSKWQFYKLKLKLFLIIWGYSYVFLCVFNGFWFYSILAGWSNWQWLFLKLSQKFWSFDTPDISGSASAMIWNRLQQFLSEWKSLSLFRSKVFFSLRFLIVEADGFFQCKKNRHL